LIISHIDSDCGRRRADQDRADDCSGSEGGVVSGQQQRDPCARRCCQATGDATDGPTPQLDRLTEREEDVLEHIALGRSNAEIARALLVGEGTVKTHVAAVLRKLGVRDRTQAAVAAYELGLVRPGTRH